MKINAVVLINNHQMWTSCASSMTVDCQQQQKEEKSATELSSLIHSWAIRTIFSRQTTLSHIKPSTSSSEAATLLHWKQFEFVNYLSTLTFAAAVLCCHTTFLLASTSRRMPSKRQEAISWTEEENSHHDTMLKGIYKWWGWCDDLRQAIWGNFELVNLHCYVTCRVSMSCSCNQNYRESLEVIHHYQIIA